MADITNASSAAPVPFYKRPRYKWAIVAMLWWMCFFNYADRQAVSAVLPLLEKEMHLTAVQLGMVGAAFALVYGVFAPFAGNVGDIFRRKSVILWGLWVWSLICALTAQARNLPQLLVFRAAEGLGETFYFPATTSLISDYHGKRTRSRALGLHNTGVYMGTIGGSVFAGLISAHYGWRSSFMVFGILGILLGLALMWFIVEPKRGAAERAELTGISSDRNQVESPAPRQSLLRVAGAMLAYVACLSATTYAGYRIGQWTGFDLRAANIPVAPFLGALPGIAGGVMLSMYISQGKRGLEFLRWLFSTPTALVLMLVFMGANFVALVSLWWMPKFLYDKYHYNLAVAGLVATIFINTATMIGAPVGGALADILRRRTPGGRMIVQAAALILAAPFVFLTGATKAVGVLMVALSLWGLLKGMYDANIFASAFDVIPPHMRGTAAGFMNMAGWLGAFPAPIMIGYISEQRNLSFAIASASVVYVGAAVLMILGVLLFAKRDAARMEQTLLASAE